MIYEINKLNLQFMEKTILVPDIFRIYWLSISTRKFSMVQKWLLFRNTIFSKFDDIFI